MKLTIRNKFISFGGASTVKDENGNDVYKVKGKMFSWRKKKTICDMDGNVLYRVRNKSFNFLFNKSYIFDANGNKLGTVKMNVGLRAGYVLTGYKEEISMLGRLISLNRQICANGVPIGNVHGRILSLVDTFDLEVLDESYAPLLVAFVIAVDNIQDKNHKDSNN